MERRDFFKAGLGVIGAGILSATCLPDTPGNRNKEETAPRPTPQPTPANRPAKPESTDSQNIKEIIATISTGALAAIVMCGAQMAIKAKIKSDNRKLDAKLNQLWTEFVHEYKEIYESTKIK